MMSLLIPLVLGCWIQEREEPIDADADGDGALSDAVEGGTDCDDSDPEVHPGADEACDGFDDDCDGAIDEGVETLWFGDADADGFGADDATTLACVAPAGHVAQGGDCDDGDGAVHPDADEVCDEVDNDCDGYTDEPGATGSTVFYTDGDGDGYGDPEATTLLCGDTQGYASQPGDCDDGDAETSPGAEEICDDGVDNDCDGSTGACRWVGEATVDDAVGSLATPEGVGPVRWVDWAGDLNHDGHEDAMVGAAGASSGTGVAYVLFGPLSAGLGSPAVSYVGQTAFGNVGYHVLADGDLDEDGVDDLVVGPSGVNSNTLNVFLGPVTAGQVVLDGSSADVLVNCSGLCSWNLTALASGDMDGDGDRDLVVGDGGAKSVVALDPIDAPNTWFFRLTGPSVGQLGRYVDSDGDLDGDGAADLVVGGGVDGGGAVVVFHGPLAGNATIDDCDGQYTGDTTGAGVAMAGDVDGDGLDDLLVGASGDGVGAAAWLVLGPATGTGPIADSARATFEGALATDPAVGGLGDFDGDGNADLALGDRGYGATGRVVVVYGPVSGAVDLESTGVRIDGPGGGFGTALAGRVDADGDGKADLLVAMASDQDPTAYLFLGTGL